jgi:hypothetical protein
MTVFWNYPKKTQTFRGNWFPKSRKA